MKLKNKIVLFTVLVCIFSILSISVINYMISIKELKKEVNRAVDLEALGVAKDIDKWIALRKDSLDEVIESMVVNDNFEYDFARNYLAKANERNKGNEYHIVFSDKTFLSGGEYQIAAMILHQESGILEPLMEMVFIYQSLM